jgi:hypothetical protein
MAMAEDDDAPEGVEFEEEEAEVEEAEPEEIDVELDEDFEELEEDDELLDDDELGEDEEEEEAEVAAPRRRATEDEDEDEDMVAPDDVEADLDTILKDRLVTAEETQDDEDEEAEVDDRGGDGDRLQPKRADEQLCPRCFLLVRSKAPNCPVGDDACPFFS